MVDAALDDTRGTFWVRIGHVVGAGGSATHPKMPDDLPRDRTLLTTTLVAAQMPHDVPEARMLRGWLDMWAGIGDVGKEMKRQGFDVRLSQSVWGWQAEFCRSQVNPMQ